MYYTQMEKLANELNEKFMKQEPFVFKMNNTGAIGLILRSSTFAKNPDVISYVSEAGQAQVNDYIMEKYKTMPTWHHGYCFGLYASGNFAEIVAGA